MTGQAPPAVPRRVRRVARDASLRIHLRDAAFHLRNGSRSLRAAAGNTTTRWAERKLLHLAGTVERWAARIDPRNLERHERAHTPRQRS